MRKFYPRKFSSITKKEVYTTMFIEITHYVLTCYSIISYNYKANYIGIQEDLLLVSLVIKSSWLPLQSGHLKMYMH